MFARVATLAGVFAVSSAEQYRWLPNNDWSRASNWASGNGGGAVNLNVDCVNTFGSGAEIRFDQNMAVGSIDLAMNGEISFDGDIEITFDGNVGASSEWRCKSPEEMSSACPSNYVVTLANGTDIVPDTAPCSTDSILIDADEAQSILWQPGQYVQMVQVRTVANGLESFGSEADFMAHWQSYENTRYIGAAPEINQPGIVATQCINTCPVHNFDNASLTGEDRWSEEGQRMLNQTIDRRDRIVTARTELSALAGSVPMQDALDAWQDTYWTELQDQGLVDASTSFDSLDVKQVTLPPFTAGGEIMGEWMEQAGAISAADRKSVV